MGQGHWSSSFFMGSVHGFLFYFPALQSPNVSALMKLESHTHYMPEGKWIPLSIPAAPVILVVLQDGNLCEQELSVHDSESLSFTHSGCARLWYLNAHSVKCQCRKTSSWKKTFLLLLVLFSHVRCPAQGRGVGAR